MLASAGSRAERNGAVDFGVECHMLSADGPGDLADNFRSKVVAIAVGVVD